MSNELSLILLLSAKHFLIDFPLQTPYQWQNKGTYGHPGGLLHSGLHGFGTFAVLMLFVSWPVSAIFGLVDMLAHYHIDWVKMNINKKMGWAANTHAEFWTLMGADQFAHTLTYIGIIYAISGLL